MKKYNKENFLNKIEKYFSETNLLISSNAKSFNDQQDSDLVKVICKEIKKFYIQASFNINKYYIIEFHLSDHFQEYCEKDQESYEKTVVDFLILFFKNKGFKVRKNKDYYNVISVSWKHIDKISVLK